ncbi:MAG: tetratricopeptide repeat protein, partial [Candidatus Hydrogenedentota bacterium]
MALMQKFIFFVLSITLTFSLTAKKDDYSNGVLLDEAFSYYYSSNYEKAVEYFEKYIDRVGDQEVPLRYLGKLYLIGQKPEKAIQYLKRALKQNPKSIEAYLLLAQAYLQLKEIEQAIQTYEKVLSIDPFELTSLSRLAYLYETKKDSRKAAAYYKRIILSINTKGGNPNLLAKAYSSLANYYYSKGQYNRAIEYYEKFQKMDPKNPRVTVVLAELYKMVGRFHDCIQLLDTLLLGKPDYGPAMESIIESMYITEDPRTRGYLLRFLKDKKKVSLLHQGMLYELSGKDKQAKEAFEKLLKHNSNRLAAHIGLAKIFLRENNRNRLRQEAFTCVILAQKLTAARVAYKYLNILYDILKQQAEEMNFKKRFFNPTKEGALLLGSEVERLAKDYTELYSTHSDILQADHKIQQAIAYKRLAIFMIDTLLEWYQAQKQDLLNLEKKDSRHNNQESETLNSGLKLLTQNMKKVEKKIRGALVRKYGTVIDLAWLLRNRKVHREKEAIQLLKAIIEKVPDYPQGYALLSIIEYDLGENNSQYWQKGIQHIEKAIELQRKRGKKIPASYFFYYALHAEKLKKYRDMEIAMKEAIKRDPYNPAYLNFLGYMYSLQNRNLDEAETLLLRALEDEPENPAYLDSYGWILFKKGKVNLAFKNLIRAKEITDKKKVPDMVIYFHLAEVYYYKKEWDLAYQHYKKVITFKGTIAEDLPFEKIKEKMKKIESLKKQAKNGG